MTTEGRGKVWTGANSWFEADVKPQNTLSDMEARPWLYWSPMTRERVAKFLDSNRKNWKECADAESLQFPINRQNMRDMERAYSDLLRLIGYPQPIAHPSVSVGESWDANGSAVGMGEEPAP